MYCKFNCKDVIKQGFLDLQKTWVVWCMLYLILLLLKRIQPKRFKWLTYIILCSNFIYLYHKLNPADCVVSLKSIPNVTAIVAPGPNDAIKQNIIITMYKIHTILNSNWIILENKPTYFLKFMHTHPCCQFL